MMDEHKASAARCKLNKPALPSRILACETELPDITLHNLSAIDEIH